MIFIKFFVTDYFTSSLSPLLHFEAKWGSGESVAMGD